MYEELLEQIQEQPKQERERPEHVQEHRTLRYRNTSEQAPKTYENT